MSRSKIGKSRLVAADTIANAPAKRLMVLDTSVLLHDPESMLRFQEHDVFLPGELLAQLDRKKSGQTDVARNARQVSRTLDEIFKGDQTLMRDGASLCEISHGAATGKIFFQMETLTFPLSKDLLYDEGDRRIIAVTCALRRERKQYSKVVLVTKDMNMRYAALRVEGGNIGAQDYLNDKLPTGFHVLPTDFWETHAVISSGKNGAHSFWRIQGSICQKVWINECVYLEDGSLFARVKERSDTDVLLETLTDYRNGRNTVWGIRARNREQNIALNHLMNPEIDLVILLGDAGTGKSISALAAAFAHLKRGRRTPDENEPGISHILVTRAMVPVGGEELGFLPGGVQDKFGPWMMAIEDTKDALFANALKYKLW